MNAASNTVASTVTLGKVDGFEMWAVTDADRRAGYNAAYGFARGGYEVLAGVGTGGLGAISKGGTAFQVVAHTARSLDGANTVVDLGRAGYDIGQNGLSWQNAGQFAGSGLGLGATVRRNNPTSGPYLKAKGHHPHSQAAFRDHPNHDMNAAYSVSPRLLDRLGIEHYERVGPSQNRQYRAFAATGRSLDRRTMNRIEVQALVDGGASVEMARRLVARSQQSLRLMGVRGPLRTPYGG